MVRVIKWSLSVMRFLTPWVIRFILYLFTMVFLVLASFWVGVPNSVRTIAQDWMERAIDNGYPSRFDRLLYYTCVTLASATILLCWIVLAFITVGIFNLLFGVL